MNNQKTFFSTIDLSNELHRDALFDTLSNEQLQFVSFIINEGLGDDPRIGNRQLGDIKFIAPNKFIFSGEHCSLEKEGDELSINISNCNLTILAEIIGAIAQISPQLEHLGTSIGLKLTSSKVENCVNNES